MNGRAWTASEDEALALTFAMNASTLQLAEELGRTHLTVISRAKRIGIEGGVRSQSQIKITVIEAHITP